MRIDPDSVAYGLMENGVVVMPDGAIPRLSVSPADAAKSLGVARSTFDKHVLPNLAVVRIGGRVLVPLRELHRWLAWEAMGPGQEED